MDQRTCRVLEEQELTNRLTSLVVKKENGKILYLDK